MRSASGPKLRQQAQAYALRLQSGFRASQVKARTPSLIKLPLASYAGWVVPLVVVQAVRAVFAAEIPYAIPLPPRGASLDLKWCSPV